MIKIKRPLTELLFPIIWIVLCVFHLVITGEPSQVWIIIYFIVLIGNVIALLYSIVFPFFIIKDNILKLYDFPKTPKTLAVVKIKKINIQNESNKIKMFISTEDGNEFKYVFPGFFSNNYRNTLYEKIIELLRTYNVNISELPSDKST
jgi:hypothetical protein